MKEKSRYFLAVASAVIFLLLLSGCGGFYLGQKAKAPAAETFAPLPPEQLLKIAESRFKAGKFDSALRAYKEFEKVHSQSELLPYCIFGKGLCYFERREEYDRDQTATRKAMENFCRIVERYPGWKYAVKAKKKIAECRKILAKHELYVASFYERTGHYKAALVRYEGLVREYPEFNSAEPMKGVADCKMALARKPESKGFIASLFDAQW